MKQVCKLKIEYMNLEEKTKKAKDIFPNITLQNINDDGSVHISSSPGPRDVVSVAKLDRIPSSRDTLKYVIQCMDILKATEVELRLAPDQEVNYVEFLYRPTTAERLTYELERRKATIRQIEIELDVVSRYKVLPSSRPGNIRISSFPEDIKQVSVGERGEVTLEDGTTWVRLAGPSMEWGLVFYIR